MGLVNVYKYLKGVCKEDKARLFSAVPYPKARVSGKKWMQRKICVDKASFFC